MSKYSELARTILVLENYIDTASKFTYPGAKEHVQRVQTTIEDLRARLAVMVEPLPVMYAVFDTDTGEFYGKPSGDKGGIKAAARTLNSARKPEYQTYTVATVFFNEEV